MLQVFFLYIIKTSISKRLCKFCYKTKININLIYIQLYFQCLNNYIIIYYYNLDIHI